MGLMKVFTSNEKMLLAHDLVPIVGGAVQLGTIQPIVCRLEGFRQNETPVRQMPVQDFWLAKYCVTNLQFEEFNPRHHRPPTSLGDHQPVTELTYQDVITYLEWLSARHDLQFRLPTEAEWVLAAAPSGWEFPYASSAIPDKSKAHTFDPANFQTLAVNDQRYGANKFGLWHMAGNVWEMTAPWYYTSGHNGAQTDGAYYIAKGGAFGHCAYSAGVQRRGIFDVTDRSSRVGYRLAHSA